MNRRRFLSLGAGALAHSALLRCRPAAAADLQLPAESVWTERMQPLMGTFVSIAIFDRDIARANEIISAAFSRLNEEISQISDWNRSSAVSRLNSDRKIAAEEIPLTLKELLPNALQIAKISGSSFSPLTLELNRVWRAARQAGSLPLRSQINKLRLDILNSTISINSSGVALTGDAGLEFGGIGKGFLVDQTARFLISSGVNAGRVAGSGDIRFIGNLGWTVEIEHPRSEDTVIGSCRLSGPVGIATSGDYRNYSEIKGRRYHHLISLEDGMPAVWNQAVTVQAGTATLADGLSTAAFLMPTNKAVQFLEQLPGVEGIVVDSAGDIHSTSGFNLRRA